MLNVVIPTTEGPVYIQSIAQEDAGIRSVMCVDGTPKETSVSPQYHAFVKTPTGVIEEALGHGAFRMDVSSEIDHGNSWQLAVLIAHWCFGKMNSSCDQKIWVWASGEVYHDRRIGNVDHIDEKIQGSKDMFHSALEREEPIFVILAPQNMEEAKTAIDLMGLGSNENLHYIELAECDDSALRALTQHFILSSPEKLSGSGDVKTPKSGAGIGRLSLWAGALLVAAFLGSGIWYIRDQFAKVSALWEQGDISALETELTHAHAATAYLFRKHLQAVRSDPSHISLRLKSEGCHDQMPLDIDLKQAGDLNLTRSRACQQSFLVQNLSDMPMTMVLIIWTETEEKVNDYFMLEGSQSKAVELPPYRFKRSETIGWRLEVNPFGRDSQPILGSEWGGLQLTGQYELKYEPEKKQRFQ